METFELAFNLSIGKKVDSMYDNLPCVDFCHGIRYLMSRVIAFVGNGYVQLLFEILDIILLDDSFSFMEILASSFHHKANKNGLLHFIKAFGQYCLIDF